MSEESDFISALREALERKQKDYDVLASKYQDCKDMLEQEQYMRAHLEEEVLRLESDLVVSHSRSTILSPMSNKKLENVTDSFGSAVMSTDVTAVSSPAIMSPLREMPSVAAVLHRDIAPHVAMKTRPYGSARSSQRGLESPTSIDDGRSSEGNRRSGSVSPLDSSVSALGRTLDSFESDERVVRMRKQIASLQEELDSIKTQRDEMSADLGHAIALIGLPSLDGTITEILKQYQADRKRELVAQQAAVASAERLCEELRQELAEAEHKYHALSTATDATGVEVSSLHEELTRKDSELSVLSDTIGGLRTEMKEKLMAIKSLTANEEALAAKDREIADLRATVGSLQQQVLVSKDSLKSISQPAQQETLSRESEIQELNETIAVLQHELRIRTEAASRYAERLREQQSRMMKAQLKMVVEQELTSAASSPVAKKQLSFPV